MIIQFLLHIHKKNVFLLPILTEVAFVLKFCIQISRTLFFSNLFEQKLFKWSEEPTRCDIVRNHRNNLFTLNPHNAMVASFFFPQYVMQTSSLWCPNFHSLISFHPVYVWSSVGYTKSVLYFVLHTNWPTVCKRRVFLQFCHEINQACTRYSPKCIQKFL